MEGFIDLLEEREALRSNILYYLLASDNADQYLSYHRERAFECDTYTITWPKENEDDTECYLPYTRTYPISVDIFSGHTHVFECIKGHNTDELNRALNRRGKEPATEDQLSRFPYYLPSATDVKNVIGASIFYTQQNNNKYMPATERVLSKNFLVTIFPSKEFIDWCIKEIEKKQSNLDQILDVVPDNIENSGGLRFFIDDMNQNTEYYMDLWRDAAETNKHEILPFSKYPKEKRILHVIVHESLFERHPEAIKK